MALVGFDQLEMLAILLAFKLAEKAMFGEFRYQLFAVYLRKSGSTS